MIWVSSPKWLGVILSCLHSTALMLIKRKSRFQPYSDCILIGMQRTGCVLVHSRCFRWSILRRAFWRQAWSEMDDCYRICDLLFGRRTSDWRSKYQVSLGWEILRRHRVRQPYRLLSIKLADQYLQRWS